jgi:hypothetical protein
MLIWLHPLIIFFWGKEVEWGSYCKGLNLNKKLIKEKNRNGKYKSSGDQKFAKIVGLGCNSTKWNNGSRGM